MQVLVFICSFRLNDFLKIETKKDNPGSMLNIIDVIIAIMHTHNWWSKGYIFMEFCHTAIFCLHVQI